MKIFDLHCDTIEALKKHNETFDNSTTQFTMKGQENLEKAVQFLAVWLLLYHIRRAVRQCVRI